MPKKYKVELNQIFTYCFDSLAANRTEAAKKAIQSFNLANKNGTLHYHEVNDESVEICCVYDVTHTDDPFNP